MSKVYFISDLHFGHKRIIEFSGEYRTGDTWEENAEVLVDNWNSVVTKRDTVFVLGDVAFSRVGFEYVRRLKGNLRLIMGNHDQFKSAKYLEVFNSIHGIMKYRGYWLTHCPIHPRELSHSNKMEKNIHGHVHANSIMTDKHWYDKNYINVCCEAINETPISFADIDSGEYWNIKKC